VPVSAVFENPLVVHEDAFIIETTIEVVFVYTGLTVTGDEN
jgi:hypothetical protein